jgi:hypothetical protein
MGGILRQFLMEGPVVHGCNPKVDDYLLMNLGLFWT